MTHLPGLLSMLEDTWRQLGFPPEKAYSRGLEPSEVRGGLREITANPCEEVIEWFCWHDGLHDPEGGLMTMAPSYFSPMSLEAALAERAARLMIADDMARQERHPGGLNDPPEFWWEPTWLPIGEMGGPCTLAIDVEDNSGSGMGIATVYVVDWGGGPGWRAPVAASLYQTVSMWIMTLNAGYYEWSDEKGWLRDFANLPIYLRGSRIIG